MSSTFRRLPLPQTAIIVALGLAASTSAFAQSQLQTQITPQMRSEARAVMQACRADYDRLCSDVTPGGGRILACLQTHAGQLTASCAQTLPRAQALRDGAVSAGVAPK
ncbi:cysteine rich repeat-containing protein [Bradyrhizobium xenonodulans]|uniref:Cysteine rich repeat-containing protein n=1 Tax=Bradyrhizobium xenonodulans TaxID=2736875 RepID=A0ABY7MJB5_9BRAD|nr:cysteine rich repeat-containing protein [Bradyrhizobium xenonodulans]WBL78495.1 cysteine rich repeat-containing protein [Bradyrhizobium xenonodulans]